MNYLTQIDLLPSFRATRLNESLVEKYFDGFPTATAMTADYLSDSIGYDSKIPFNNNVLLVVSQKFISSDNLNEDNLSEIIPVLGYIDFKIALMFFVQLKESFSGDYLLRRLQSEGSEVFVKRLETFLSVFTAELLCADNNHDIL